MNVSRKREGGEVALIPPDSKRQKPEQEDWRGGLARAQQDVIPRTSDIKSPIMLLTGHNAEVNTTRFSPDGEHIVTASRDKLIFLWNTFGDCENYMVLSGHKNSVLQAEWTLDNNYICSCSADKTLGLWDVNTGSRVLNYNSHDSVVNAFGLGTTTHNFASVSDDSTCRIWDRRKKLSAFMIQRKFPLTAVAYHDERYLVFTGGLDNKIDAWDVRNISTLLYSLVGHVDTITSLALDPQNIFLLSNSSDNQIKTWDIRPFATDKKSMKTFVGAFHGYERGLIRANWSPDSSMVCSGSFDNQVCIWDSFTGEWKYHLPGHKACVNDVSFHPKQPIIVSGGSDKNVFLGEIEND